MERIAIIDIGSNSARLVISHMYKSGAYNMVYNQKEALRLSQKVNEKGILTEAAFTSTVETMKSFAYMCKIYHADTIIAVATAAIRNATNGQELVDLVTRETGIKLQIISGKEEAYYSYLGVINTLDVANGIIFDLGGGSTELIYFKNRRIVESVSLKFGAVNTTDKFKSRNEMTPAIYAEMTAFIMKNLEQYPWLKQKNLPLIGVGGTARTVAKIIQRSRKYPMTKIHNYSLSLQIFRDFFSKLRTTNLEQRKKISGLSSERSDIILAGSNIINCLLETTGASKIISSGCGLREGLFFKFYSETTGQPLVARNILERSRDNILHLYTADVTHSLHIRDLALTMFDNWMPMHGLRKGYRKLLETAALLHDIGITINFYSHARHSAYMIQNAQLFGLTHKEQIIAAAIAGWHNGVSKNYYKAHLYKEMLSSANWKVINKLALLLALAESMDYTQTSQIVTILPRQRKKQAILGICAPELPGIEMHQLRTHMSWFKKTFDAELKVELANPPVDSKHLLAAPVNHDNNKLLVMDSSQPINNK